MKKLISLEFNELCPALVSRFIDEGYLPNMKKLRDESIARETLTDATGDELNPWVQWVDVHTGREREDHGVSRLNELDSFNGEFTWDILSKYHGISSWICGSMNANYSQENFKGRFLPDPWNQDVPPVPSHELETYYNFVSQSVIGHSKKANVRSAEFVRCLLKQNIKTKTIYKLIKQVVSEKFSENVNWKRAMMLDWIQLDIFKYHYKKCAPQYATFFSNTVAHYQHHYWRDFEPEKFGVTTQDIDKSKRNAILDAYKCSDSIVGEILKFIDKDSAVIFSTALSQEPYTEGDRFYYHITDEGLFFRAFKIPSNVKYRPVMAEQFHLHAEDNRQARKIESLLNSFVMDGDEYFHVGTNKIFLVSVEDSIVHVQCRCTKDVRSDATFFSGSERFRFYDYFYRMNETKSGKHNQRGIYWTKGLNLKDTSSSAVPPSQIHNDVLEYFAT